MDPIMNLRSVRRSSGRILIASLGALLALAAPSRAEDPGWPREFDSQSGRFVIYQPQPETLEGDVLTGRAAFSLQRSLDAEPLFGVLWFTETIFIDRDSSSVAARHFDVTKVRLPGITPAEASRYEGLVEAEAVSWDLSGSLEELRAGLASAEKERASVADLDTLPPRIVFSQSRAILVVYDGEPMLGPIGDTGLERVVNTPYAVVHDPSSRAYYLSGADVWYEAGAPLGPWRVVTSPPAAVRDVVPPDTSAADQIQGMPPLVLTATVPTELIWTDGPPQYAPLVGDELLYVTNTESDVVREVGTQAVYVLLAGRWYRAPTFSGPWTFVRGDRLPASFSRISPESPKANLLASVAGTGQADDAVADAEIPQTTAIRRGPADFEVTYDGRPQFERIPGSALEYAVNTDAEVILADGRYYACDQGVWYVADDPEGPWQVSETRPVGLEDIPPSCPVYNVRYVYIYDATPDVVYVGYLPGYLGCYPYYGTVVYGTGYYYHPWRGRHRFYPRPWTWGFQPRYNPWLSRWSFGCSFGSGFLRVGFIWYSAPRTHAIHDPQRWLGPGGYRRPLLEPDGPMARTRRALRMPARPDRVPMNLYRRTVNTPRVDLHASRVPARRIGAPIARPERVPNNVFAGKDGRVYRREEGGWKMNRGRSWVPAPVEVKPRGNSTPGAGNIGRIEPIPNWPPPPPAPSQPAPQRAPQRSPASPAPAEPPRAAPAPPPPAASAPPPPAASAPPPPAASAPPPPASPQPGNLEREFHGRERGAAPGASRVPDKGVEKEKGSPGGKR